MALSVVSEPDNAEYGGLLISADGGVLRFRVGKLTPKKVGLFVTVWQRAADGSTQPFADDGTVDLLVVDVREGEKYGQFVFPTAELARRGVVSVADVGGKRGFRVYPPWAQDLNRQAAASQTWQCRYFLDLVDVDLGRARDLYGAVL